MSYQTPFCPRCGAVLSHNDEGDFNPWVCPKGHGMAATLSEGYQRVDGDELKELWRRARSQAATPSDRPCPMCERRMVVADVPAQVAGHGEVPIDVCTTDEVLWFDSGEIGELPVAGDRVPPSPEEQAHLDQIMAAFDQGLDQAMDERDRQGLTNHFADGLTGRSHLFGMGEAASLYRSERAR